MIKQLFSKLTIGAALLALVTPSAFACVTGGDPEPGGGIVHLILHAIGLA